MKNKLLIIFGISICIMLTASQAINYVYKTPTPQAILNAVDLGMKQSTAQAMYDDGVAAKDIRPRFVSAWKKDKQGQVGGRKQFEVMQKRMNSPLLQETFDVMSSDLVKQKLIEKERTVQLKSGNNNKRGSLSLAEIKQMMSNDEFMAYTDMLWHRRTSQPLLVLPLNHSKSAGGQQIASTLSVGDSCTFPNLATALFSAQDGDTIIVQAKTFAGLDAQISISGKSINIIGGYDSTCQVFTANRTVLQSNLPGPVVDIDVSGGKTVELFGLDISGSQTNGTDYTSGVNITGDGDVIISNTHIHDNESKFGGGISILNVADVTIDQNTEIYSNHVTDDGGGIFCENGRFTADDTLIGRFNGVAQGNITDVNGLGGGIYSNNCPIRLGKISGPVELSYNNAHSGAAIYLTNSDDVEIWDEDSRISFNQGGSIVNITQNSKLLIADIKISDNLNNVSVLNIGQNSILQMISSCAESPCAEISRNEGITVYASNNAMIDIGKTMILDNTGVNVIQSSSPDGTDIFIRNSMLVNNSADTLITSDSQNGSISFMSLQHLTIANNPGTVAVFESNNNSNINLISNIVWGNGFANLQSAGSANITVENSVIQYDPTGMLNTVQQDPLFIDAANNNWHIQRTSPAIDRANSSINIDIDRDPRPIGNGKDSGADEYSDLVGINGAACDYATVGLAIAAASDNDTIYISKGTYFEQLGLIDKDLDFVSATDDCSAVDLAAIKTDVTIDGNNQNVFHGGILEIDNDKQISFSNMSLKNAQAFEGGIIFMKTGSSLVLTDVNASNGSVAGAGEGGIIKGLAMTSITLNGNTAIFSGLAISHGGGISTPGTLDMNDTSHIGVEDFGNQAQTGAGIQCSGCTLILNDDSMIYANIASQDGGGVSTSRQSSITLNHNAKIGSGFFSTGNRAKYAGGLNMHSNINGNIGLLSMNDNSSIQHNTITPDESIFTTRGGAGVYLTSTNASLTSGSISFNRINPMLDSTSYGVGIFAKLNLFDNPMNIIMGEQFFINNNTQVDSDGEVIGGGIAITDAGNSLTINGATISNNTANKGGGIAVLNFAALTLNQAIIDTNNASDPTEFYSRIGGGIYAGLQTIVNINDSTISNNNSMFGGGLYAFGSTLTITGNNQGVLFENNTAGHSGGGFFHTSSSVNLVGSVTLNQNSASFGGGIYSRFATFENSPSSNGSLRVVNNMATFHGGGMYFESIDNAGTLTLNQAVFDMNSATKDGGGIELSNGSSIIIDSTFSQNSAGENGGALHLTEFHNSNISASTNCLEQQIAPEYCSEFVNNTSINSGDGIMVESSTLSLNSTVLHDHTSANLGMLLMDVTSNVDLNNDLFYNNGNVGTLSNGAGQLRINQVTMDNSGLKVTSNNPTSIIDNSILWNTVVDVPVGVQGNCNISPNAELPGGSGDPLFYTSLKGPYHLSANSPAVDACSGSAIRDLDGRTRPIDSDGIASGSEYDMGAFERPLFGTLTISLSGSGSVVSNLAGIDCGVDCSEDYEIGTQIELTATPANGFAFSEWTGACVGQSAVCTIPINGTTATQAVFVAEYTVTVVVNNVTGIGHVDSSLPGINCGIDCDESFLDGTVLQLNATADNAQSLFSHWTGACLGQDDSCDLTINSDTNTTAVFVNPDIIFKHGFE